MPRAKKAADVAVETTEVKEEVKEEVNEEVKAAKKTAVKKPAKAKEPEVNVVVEYLDKNVAVKDLIEAVKEACKANGKADNIETINIYYQPENNKAYYVVDGTAQETPVEV